MEQGAAVRFKNLPKFSKFQFVETMTIPGTLITSHADGWKPTFVKVGERSYQLTVGNKSHPIESINVECVPVKD